MKKKCGGARIGKGGVCAPGIGARMGIGSYVQWDAANPGARARVRTYGGWNGHKGREGGWNARSGAIGWQGAQSYQPRGKGRDGPFAAKG